MSLFGDALKGGIAGYAGSGGNIWGGVLGVLNAMSTKTHGPSETAGTVGIAGGGRYNPQLESQLNSSQAPFGPGAGYGGSGFASGGYGYNIPRWWEIAKSSALGAVEDIPILGGAIRSGYDEYLATDEGDGEYDDEYYDEEEE